MKMLTKFKLIQLLDGLYFSTIITSVYVVAHGVTLAQVIFAQGLYSTVVLLTEVPTGLIADKFGKKTSLALGYVLSGLGPLVVIASPTYLGLLAMRTIQATGSALVSGAAEALLYDTTSKQGLNYKRIYGAITSYSTLGLAVAGVVAGILYGHYNNAAFLPLLWATVATQFVAVVIVSMLYEAKQTKGVKIKSWDIIAQSSKLLRRNSTLFALTAVGFLTICNEYFLYGTYAPFFGTRHVSNFFVGGAFSAGLVLNFFLQRNSWRLEKYFTLEKALAIINFSVALGYIGLAYITQQPLLVLVFVLTVGIFNIERPIISDYANQHIESHIRATVLSGMSLVNRISKLILTFFMGILVSKTSIEAAYMTQGLYIAVGMVVSWWLLVRCGCVNRVEHVGATT